MSESGSDLTICIKLRRIVSQNLDVTFLIPSQATGRIARNQDWKESVRFDSFRFRTFRKFIGSVRFGNYFPGSTRFGLRFSDASWLGPVRFGSFPRPVPAGSRIKRFGSVRFGGSVRFLIPSCYASCVALFDLSDNHILDAQDRFFLPFSVPSFLISPCPSLWPPVLPLFPSNHLCVCTPS